MKQRYFFGLKPPAAVAQGLNGVWTHQADGQGRGHHMDDLHLTLVFLGDLDLSVDQVAALADAVQAAPFSLSLERLDFWAKPRVLVARPGQIPLGLQDLVHQLSRSAGAAGILLEKRPYRPHITLAGKAQFLECRLLESVITWPVADFCLFLSDWNRPPPHYRVVGRWPLSGTVSTAGSVQ